MFYHLEWLAVKSNSIRCPDTDVIVILAFWKWILCDKNKNKTLNAVPFICTLLLVLLFYFWGDFGQMRRGEGGSFSWEFYLFLTGANASKWAGEGRGGRGSSAAAAYMARTNYWIAWVTACTRPHSEYKNLFSCLLFKAGCQETPNRETNKTLEWQDSRSVFVLYV